jgi:hypothetical protein
MGLHAYLHQLWLPLRQHWRGYHPCHHSHLPRLHANRLHAIKTTNFAYTLGRALQNKLRHVLSGDRDLAVWWPVVPSSCIRTQARQHGTYTAGRSQQTTLHP